MAKMLSIVGSVIRGSVGGITYSANQYAQIYIKSRTAPVQPDTNPQTLQKSCLAAGSLEWLGLTDTARAGWENYALTVQYQGPLGNYNLSGRSIFLAGYTLQKRAVASGLVGATLVTTAPTTPGRISLGVVAPATYVGPGTGIGFDIGNPSDDDIDTLINVSPPQNPTRMRYKGPWDSTLTQWQTCPDATDSNWEIDDLAVGMAYFVRIRPVAHAKSPRIGIETIIRCVAATVA